MRGGVLPTVFADRNRGITRVLGTPMQEPGEGGASRRSPDGPHHDAARGLVNLDHSLLIDEQRPHCERVMQF